MYNIIIYVVAVGMWHVSITKSNKKYLLSIILNISYRYSVFVTFDNSLLNKQNM